MFHPPSPRRNVRGNAMVEFALIFTLFVLVVAAVVEFGRAVWTFTTLAHAARQGARFAMIRGSLNPATSDQVRNVVRNAAIGLDTSQVNVTTQWPNGIQKGNVVQVRVRYPFELVSGTLLVSRGGGSNIIQMQANSEIILAN